MAKIHLTIDKHYCSDWHVWHGIRELIQNAKDADEDGYKMEVTHYPRTSRLEIVSKKVSVEPAKLLVLGKTDKAPGQKRGQFGEGFVLGVLALMRKGCDVRFKNGYLSWSASFEEPEEGHPLAGNELLTFQSRQLQSREEDFIIEISDIPGEAWDVMKKQFLFITPPAAADTFKTNEGTLLLHPDYKGRVFSRGILVKAFQGLECGYDVENLKLDRDRQFVDEWDLNTHLSAIWKAACATNPELAAPRVYEMVKNRTSDVRYVKYHADDKLLAAVRSQFEKEHGENAVPVRTMAEAKETEALGAKPAMVNDLMQELLKDSGLSLEGTKKSLEGQIAERFAPSDLTPAERAVLDRLTEVVPEFTLVTFRGPAACRMIDDGKGIGVDRRLLSGAVKSVLKQLVGLEAQRRNCDAVDVLLECLSKTSYDDGTCDECGFRIPDDEKSLANPSHAESCSLYDAPT